MCNDKADIIRKVCFIAIALLDVYKRQVQGIALAGAGMGAVFVGRPSAPVVVQRIAGEEGRLIRRALGAQTADCAGPVSYTHLIR